MRAPGECGRSAESTGVGDSPEWRLAEHFINTATYSLAAIQHRTRILADATDRHGFFDPYYSHATSCLNGKNFSHRRDAKNDYSAHSSGYRRLSRHLAF